MASTRFKYEFLSEELAGGNVPHTLLVHSHQDKALPWERVEESLAHLERAGGDVERFFHEDGHFISPHAVQHIGAWLSRKGFDAETRA